MFDKFNQLKIDFNFGSRIYLSYTLDKLICQIQLVDRSVGWSAGWPSDANWSNPIEAGIEH